MSVAPKRQFVLFATIFEATLIDKKFSGKPCHFEICIGKLKKNYCMIHIFLFIALWLKKTFMYSNCALNLCLNDNP